MANNKKAKATRSGKKSHAGRNTVIGAAALLALLGYGHFGLGWGAGLGGLPGFSGNGGAQTSGTSAVSGAQNSEGQPSDDGGTVYTPPQEQQNEAPDPQESQPDQTPSARDDNELSIVIRESVILYEGEAVTLTELEEALLRDYKAEKTVTLTDDHTIKATYDDVAALLTRLDIPLSR